MRQTKKISDSVRSGQETDAKGGEGSGVMTGRVDNRIPMFDNVQKSCKTFRKQCNIYRRQAEIAGRQMEGVFSVSTFLS